MKNVSMDRALSAPIRAWRGRCRAVTALLCALAAGCSHTQPEAKPTVSRFIKDLQPIKFERRSTETSFTSDDKRLQVAFLDLGSDIGLVLRAADNVLINVDVNQDGKPSEGIDRVYGVDLDTGEVCVPFVDSDPSDCRATRSEAKGAVSRNNERREILFRIPKQELGASQTEAHVVFETFAVARDEASRRYPEAESFQKVFRLMYATQGEIVPDEWPQAPTKKSELPPPAPITGLRATPPSVYAGETAKLTWDVRPADKATLSDFGEVEPKGERSVSPDKTTKYTLRAFGPGGDMESDVTIAVKDLEIISFRVSPQSVHQDGTFTLEWHVRGATATNIEALGWPQGAQMSLPESVRAAQSKLIIRASRKEFKVPGKYTYRLKASGPGGPKFASADIEVLP
jgi:hypothetical protein